MMIKSWHDEAWDDYLYWQTQDKKTCNYSAGDGYADPRHKNLRFYGAFY
jgi:hypothetical protein